MDRISVWAALPECPQPDASTLVCPPSLQVLRRGFDARILAQIPDELISWESVEGPHHSGTVTFHAVSTVETRVTVEVDWDPRTVLERAGATAHLEDRQIKKNLERFKEFIEGREVETGAWRGSIAGGKVEGRS